MIAGGEAGNIYAATLTLYIASPATDIAGLPPPASYLQFKASVPCHPVSGHSLRIRNAQPHSITKSTQIGHKLCTDRRNWVDFSTCLAFNA